jgi:hypothetical protein
MIIYFVWTVILIVHRGTVTIKQDGEGGNAKEFSQYDGSEVHNPAYNSAGGEDFGADQEQS